MILILININVSPVIITGHKVFPVETDLGTGKVNRSTYCYLVEGDDKATWKCLYKVD